MAHIQSTVTTPLSINEYYPGNAQPVTCSPAQLADDWLARLHRRMALDDLIEPQFDDETCADDTIYPTAA